MQTLNGLEGARGQAIGRAVMMYEERYQIQRKTILDPAHEVDQLEEARQQYRQELDQMHEEALRTIGEEAAGILRAYKEMNDDDIFFKNIKKRVQNELINVEYALEEEKKTVASVFLGMDDPYMKERGTDIENVCNALIKKLLGILSPFEQISRITEDFIIIAEDLTPADTVRLDKTYLKGFITEKGGKTSHTVILAKTLGIPAIVGAKGIMELAINDQLIYMNGEAGSIIIEPDETILNQYEQIKQQTQQQAKLLAEISTCPAVTTDGHRIEICVNSGNQDSIDTLDITKCDGIGLFRTEFLYMKQHDYPSEAEQFEIYKKLAEKAKGKQVIIRTLDIGGDKQLDYMDLPKEENPFLGYRAIRICLDRIQVFKTQLRAILRASAYGNVAIMFPMIVAVEELRKAKEIVMLCKQELTQEGKDFNSQIKIGIMIETPAAVLLSDRLAKESDFFSVGTNDLIQYITATDRMNERTQYLYNVCNLSVLKAMEMIIKNAHADGIPVGICGESASDEKMIKVWLGLGIDELSMVPVQTAGIKHIIRNTSLTEAKMLCDKIFQMDTAAEVERYLKTMTE